MRCEVVFQEARAAGYTLDRICGSHHTFTKPGRTCLPIPVHGGKVREDVYREILRIVAMPEDVWRERSCPSPRKKQISRADNSRFQHIDNATSSSGTASPTKLRSNRHSDLPTLLTSEEKEAYTEMRAKQQSEREERQHRIAANADELLRSGPVRIASGNPGAVAADIYGLLGQKGDSHISLYVPEEVVLELSFLYVTAWVEEARSFLESTKAGAAKVMPSSGADGGSGDDYDKKILENIGRLSTRFRDPASDSSASGGHRENAEVIRDFPFDNRDFKMLLGIFRRLEETHWRHQESVREVRLHAVRQVAVINHELLQLRLESWLIAGDVTGVTWAGFCDRCMSHFQRFLKALSSEDDFANLVKEISKEPSGAEIIHQFRVHLSFPVFNDTSDGDMMAIMSPSDAAAKLNQIDESMFFVDNKSLANYRQLLLRVAHTREELNRRVAEAAGAGHLSSRRDPDWKRGVSRLLSNDLAGTVKSLRGAADALMQLLLVVGESRHSRGCTESPGYADFQKGAILNVEACTMGDMLAFLSAILFYEFGGQFDNNFGTLCLDANTANVSNLLSRLAHFPSSASRITDSDAAEVSVLLVLFGIIAKVSCCEPLQQIRDATGDPGTKNLQAFQRFSAMQLWRTGWKDSTATGDATSNSLLDIDTDLPPPKKFLRVRNPSLNTVARIGRRNPLVQDALRLSLLHSTKECDLPQKWRPLEFDVERAIKLVSSYFFIMFHFSAASATHCRESRTSKQIHPLDAVIKIMRGNRIVDSIKLLIARPLECELRGSKKEIEQLKRVIGKLQAARACDLITEAHFQLFDLVNNQDLRKVATSNLAILRLATIEEEVTASLTKVLDANWGTKDFTAVYRGGVDRTLARLGVGKGGNSPATCDDNA